MPSISKFIDSMYLIQVVFDQKVWTGVGRAGLNFRTRTACGHTGMSRDFVYCARRSSHVAQCPPGSDLLINSDYLLAQYYSEELTTRFLQRLQVSSVTPRPRRTVSHRK